ncbi:MAG: hypothetical protein N2C14_20775, partial [Planctomycetales bacterium]
TPGGVHQATNVTSFKFLSLPRDESGRLRPVAWFRKRLSGDSESGYAWRFPVDTVLGEVLMMKGPDGNDFTFEMRIRVREQGDWGVDVFRPFPETADLVRAIKQRRPDWKSNEKTAALIDHLETSRELPVKTLKSPHPTQAFHQESGVDMLPGLDDQELVTELLTETEFKSASGTTWRVGANKATAFAPTTKAAFHIVPAGYQAGFIEVHRESCIRCHQTVGQHVDRFEPGREWYGRIRGSDGVFSFHPFDPSSISGNGFGGEVRMRAKWIAAGLVEQFDPKKHPNKVYHNITSLGE